MFLGEFQKLLDVGFVMRPQHFLQGFWNGFLLGQTCEVPTTARGNHFGPCVCFGNLDMFICCTGISLLGQEQKMTVLANWIIPDIHSQLGKVSTYQFAAHFTYWALSFRDAGLDNI